MKAYVILLKDKDNDIQKYPGRSESKNYNGLPLYGITNRKDYIESFIDTRDMNKFMIKKIYTESEDDYNRFIDINDINTYELTTSTFQTTVEFNGKYTIGYVKVVCTIKESDAVEYDYDSEILDKVADMATNIHMLMKEHEKRNIDSRVIVDAIKDFTMLFNKKIRNALEYLEFVDFMEDAIYEMDELDSSEFNLREDKLRIYCKMFGNTYKKV